MFRDEHHQSLKTQDARNNVAETIIIGMLFIGMLTLLFRILRYVFPKSFTFFVKDNKKQKIVTTNQIIVPDKKEVKESYVKPTRIKEQSYSQVYEKIEQDKQEIKNIQELNARSASPKIERRKTENEKNDNVRRASSAITDAIQKKIRERKIAKKQRVNKEKANTGEVKKDHLKISKERKNETANDKTANTISEDQKKWLSKNSFKVINAEKSKNDEKIKKQINSEQLLDNNIVNVHTSIINQLYIFYKKEWKLTDDEKLNLGILLNFEKLALLPTEYASKTLCQNFLLCARVGIDIQSQMKTVCTSYFIDGLSKEDIATLLFACFLHDANVTHPTQIIDTTLIKKLFVIADSLYVDAAKKIRENNYQEHMIALTLFKSKKDKFANNNLKESKFFRYLLDAATFYHFEMSDIAKTYLNYYVLSNDESLISVPQQKLFDLLSDQFSQCGLNLTIELEEKINVGSYNADILIRCLQSNRVIDIEYDGQDHFYKNRIASGVATNQYKREYIARDNNLISWGIQVFRCTKNDVFFDANNGNTLISERLQTFISEIKSQTLNMNLLPKRW